MTPYEEGMVDFLENPEEWKQNGRIPNTNSYNDKVCSYIDLLNFDEEVWEKDYENLNNYEQGFKDARENYLNKKYRIKEFQEKLTLLFGEYNISFSYGHDGVEGFEVDGYEFSINPENLAV